MASKIMKEPRLVPLASRRGVIFHPTLGYAIPPPLPPTVARRNARERTRVKTVNQSYEHLRLHVPSASQAKKMSKVDILKHSIEYIQKLRAMVEGSEYEQHQHQESVHLPSGMPPCPNSPCTPGSTSGESGYSSPLPQAFLFPSTTSSSPPSYQTTSKTSSNLMRTQEEDDMILDVILDWQKS